MARKARNYAAEYARRIAKGPERPLAERRGHVSQVHERAQRQEAVYRRRQGLEGPRLVGANKLALWAGKTVPPDMDPDEWQAILRAAVENRGGKDEDREAVADKLRRKWEITNEYERLIKGGHSPDYAADYSGADDFYDDRDEYDPIEMYWYHES